MNVLKSALRLSKPQSLQPLYEDVKSWDQARARFLETHLKVVQLVIDALDLKVSQVEKYIEGLDKLMSARIEEITSYCKNGVNDSEFFLVPSSLNSLKPCHQLLKHLLMEESQRELALSKKGTVLSNILERLKKLKAAECAQQGEQEGEREGDTIRQLKSNIRYLIDCELPDLIEEVLGACRGVSQAYEEEKSFYLSVERFVRVAGRQLKKHQEIGREVLSLVGTFSVREKELRGTLREILLEWVRQDFEDKIFHEQLGKKCSDDLINDYYDIENLIPEQEGLWGGGSLADYLQSFQVLPFREHERLVVYSRQVFYNAKIEARVILTQQKNAYLFRVNAQEPDFSFVLSKNIRVKVKSPLIVQVSQVHRTILLREETDFDFSLEFNLQSDLKQFQDRCVGLGCQLEAK